MIIDFFDRYAIDSNQCVNFDASTGIGSWHFKSIEEPPPETPSIHLVNMDIAYTVDQLNFSYETRRAFFTKESIRSWPDSQFDECSTELSASLLPDDLSFTFNMRRDKP